MAFLFPPGYFPVPNPGIRGAGYCGPVARIRAAGAGLRPLMPAKLPSAREREHFGASSRP